MRTESLNYDSLHKFWVSLGIVLIALPFALLALVYASAPTLISEVEFEALSNYSRELLEAKQVLVRGLSSIGVWVSLLFEIGGAYCVCHGLSSWKSVQMSVDEEVRLRVEGIKRDMASLEEKELSVIQEEAEMNEGQKSDDQECSSTLSGERANAACRDDPQQFPHKASNGKDELSPEAKYSNVPIVSNNAAKTYYLIEKECSESVSKALGSKYEIVDDVKTSRGIIDFAAVSTRDSIDLLFEVKYASRILRFDVLRKATLSLSRQMEEYRRLYKRKCRCILIVVYERDVPNIDSSYQRSRELGQAFSLQNYLVLFIERDALGMVGVGVKDAIDQGLGTCRISAQ